MSNMFAECYTNAFNQDIDAWDVSNVTSMGQMFYINKGMNRSLNSWNTSKVTSMNQMFYQSVFNGDIGNWNVSSVTNMSDMFFQSPFNKNINNWNIGKVTNFNSMFSASSFNQPLSGWSASLGTGVATTINMSNIFSSSPFNQSIENWNISKVNNFSSMFNANVSFNQSLSGWATTLGSGASVTSIDMSYIFNGATGFNGNVSGWRFDKPTSMSNSFYNTSAFNNSSITGWQTSGITDMTNMFYNNRIFNQPIGSWNVRNVTTMNNMFNFCLEFNQNLSGWNIAGLNTAGALAGFWQSVTTSTNNYNPLLIDWNNNKVSFRSDLTPNFGNSKYTSNSTASAARSGLVAYGWTITDGGSVIAAPDPPTSVSGAAGDTTVSLSWLAPVYDNGSAITDYIIQYSGNNGSSWTTFNDGVSTALSGNVTGLTNNISYAFRVAAVNVSGTGDYSSNSSSSSDITPIVSFTPTAVLLTAGTSYTVPAGATSMKAWAVGAGGNSLTAGYLWGGAGGCAYKTWSVLGGQSVTYSCGSTTFSHGNNSTVTFNAVSITGYGGRADGTGGSYSGGDGGANGGTGDTNGFDTRSGAVGGNAGTIAVCGRRAATDVNGLLAAVALAGGKSVEDCGATAAFGSSSFNNKNNNKAPGYGGGFSGGFNNTTTGPGAVVLYFT
jgi:surface protein